MARLAVIDGQTVVNIIVADAGFTLPGFTLVASDVAGPGWTYAAGAFSAPVPAPTPVPETISDRQFAQQLALNSVITQDEALAWAARGELPARMANAVAQLPEDGGQRFGAKMMLSSATTYERHHPLVPMLGVLLGFDGQALDDLWRQAASL